MTRRLAVLTMALLALLVSACGGGNPTAITEEADGPQAPRTDAERQELSFLIGMTPHHAQAVDMARLCQVRAADPGLRTTCDEIIDVQSREIRQMMAWALEWYGTQLREVQSARYSAEGASGSDGILTDEAMHELAALSGRAFDIRFTELMTEHHVGAIASARALLEASPHAEVRQLAAAIVGAQEAEIEQMRAWHANWTGS